MEHLHTFLFVFLAALAAFLISAMAWVPNGHKGLL